MIRMAYTRLGFSNLRVNQSDVVSNSTRIRKNLAVPGTSEVSGDSVTRTVAEEFGLAAKIVRVKQILSQ